MFIQYKEVRAKSIYILTMDSVGYIAYSFVYTREFETLLFLISFIVVF